MTPKPILMLVDPAHFDVSYVINPWMRPGEWAHDPQGHATAARRSFDQLKAALGRAGAAVETVPGRPGLPDMVFPANAAVVLDGRAIVARFRCPERQGEEQPYLQALQGFAARGMLDEVAIFPPGVFQEGAGDAIWDVTLQLFWAGHGQRSVREAVDELARFFGKEVVPLELATPRFYHLDTCFCVLPGGEVLYYPPAFTPASLEEIERRVEPGKRIVASDEEAAAFCVNAVALGKTVVMARAPDALKRRLAQHGYEVIDVDLDPFILSGGGAYCMTLRLDRRSH